jgi:DHA2 family multidrug resistance protein
VRGVGLGLIFIPLTTLSLSNLQGKDIPQGTGLTNMIRQLGGSFGVAVMATFIERRSAFHLSVFTDKIAPYSSAAMERLAGLTGAMISKGMDPVTAKLQGLAMLQRIAAKQAALLAYLDSFYVVGLFFLLCIPLLILFKGDKKKQGPVHVEFAGE